MFICGVYISDVFQELLLDLHFNERVEKLKAQKVEEVRKQLAWELECSRIGLRKMQRYEHERLPQSCFS